MAKGIPNWQDVSGVSGSPAYFAQQAGHMISNGIKDFTDTISANAKAAKTEAQKNFGNKALSDAISRYQEDPSAYNSQSGIELYGSLVDTLGHEKAQSLTSALKSQFDPMLKERQAKQQLDLSMSNYGGLQTGNFENSSQYGNAAVENAIAAGHNDPNFLTNVRSNAMSQFNQRIQQNPGDILAARLAMFDAQDTQAKEVDKFNTDKLEKLTAAGIRDEQLARELVQSPLVSDMPAAVTNAMHRDKHYDTDAVENFRTDIIDSYAKDKDFQKLGVDFNKLPSRVVDELIAAGQYKQMFQDTYDFERNSRTDAIMRDYAKAKNAVPLLKELDKKEKTLNRKHSRANIVTEMLSNNPNIRM